MDIEKRRVLYIEDDIVEFKFIAKMLLLSRDYQYEIAHADSLSKGIVLLKQDFEIVLLDLGLPESFGEETYFRLKEHSGELPVIVITGNDSEKMGIDLIKSGAQDYLIKGQLSSQLLLKSVNYAIERNNLIKNLNNALKEIKTLSGLIPICASCKKIRDDKGYWTQVETYLSRHSDAKFSHSICPDCQIKLYGKVF